MTNELKSVLAKFLKINQKQIDDDTVIDSSVVQGSVLFHRMISRVNDLYNIEILNYSSIKTYRDLKSEIEKLNS
jgi:hypothetical protein